jgi:hypothetical protein
MCDMHDGVQPWRRGALFAVHAHVPHRVHQQLADAFVRVPVVPRAGGRRLAHQLRNQLSVGSDVDNPLSYLWSLLSLSFFLCRPIRVLLFLLRILSNEKRRAGPAPSTAQSACGSLGAGPPVLGSLIVSLLS